MRSTEQRVSACGMRGPVAYRLRGGSRRLWRQLQSEHGPTAPGALFAERSCARSSTSGDVCIRRRSALRWVQGHRRSRLCVCEGVAPVMGAGSTRGRPAGVGTGRPGRKTRGLLHVCGVRQLRFDETAPFCTTDELKQPVRGELTLGSGCPGCNRRSGPRVRLHRWSCYVFERCSPFVLKIFFLFSVSRSRFYMIIIVIVTILHMT